MKFLRMLALSVMMVCSAAIAAPSAALAATICFAVALLDPGAPAWRMFDPTPRSIFESRRAGLA